LRMSHRHDSFAPTSRSRALAGEVGAAPWCAQADRCFSTHLIGTKEFKVDCEKFQLIGLEDPSWLPLAADRAQLAAAIEHTATCSRCAALGDYWQEVRSTLHELGESTKSAQAPKRVETQLRYHFSARHRSWWSRSTAMFAAWTLVTATLLLAGVSWWNWR